jgi:hypothetical protein
MDRITELKIFMVITIIDYKIINDERFSKMMKYQEM